MFFQKPTLLQVKKHTLLSAVQWVNDEAVFLTQVHDFFQTETKKIDQSLKEYKANPHSKNREAIRHLIEYKVDLEHIQWFLELKVKELNQAEAFILSDRNAISTYKIHIFDPLTENMILNPSLNTILKKFDAYSKAQQSKAAFDTALKDENKMINSHYNIGLGITAAFSLLVMISISAAAGIIFASTSLIVGLPFLIAGIALALAFTNLSLRFPAKYQDKQIESLPKIILSNDERNLFKELNEFKENFNPTPLSSVKNAA